MTIFISFQAHVWFPSQQGTRVAACNTDVVRNSRVVIVAVKPYQVVDVLQEVAPAVTADHIFISVAAGITIDTMQKVSADRCHQGTLPASCFMVIVLVNK